MSSIKLGVKVEPKVRIKQSVMSVRVDDELYEWVKVLGNGVASTGAGQVFDKYRESIRKSAERQLIKQSRIN